MEWRRTGRRGENERERASDCARIFGEFRQLVQGEAGTTEDTYTHNNNRKTLKVESKSAEKKLEQKKNSVLEVHLSRYYYN